MQERDAATRFIKQVFPDAEVSATQLPKDDECGGTGDMRVKISSGGVELVDVPQRDLFSKYDCART